MVTDVNIILCCFVFSFNVKLNFCFDLNRKVGPLFPVETFLTIKKNKHKKNQLAYFILKK